MSVFTRVGIGLLAMVACSPTSVAAGPVADVAQLGVVGDGVTLNTTAIQRAIDALGPAGGTVRFPAGRYLTGTVELRSGVTLQLDAGAVLLGTTDAAQYRNVDPFMAGDGVPLGYALVVAEHASHVGITGDGTLDGQGQAMAGRKPYRVRPFLCRWIGCDDVTVSGVTLRDPGAWNDHFYRCRHVRVDHVTVRSRDTRVANTDGVDVDSCQDVAISRCDISSGDDAVCIKTTSPLPCRDVTVTDCRLTTRCNGVKLGTESLGDFGPVTVDRCVMTDIGMAGIAVYCVDGGAVRDVNVSGVRMDRVATPISIRLGSRLKTFRPGDRPKTTGSIADVTIRDVTADHAGRVGVLVSGVPGFPVERLTLTNIHITLAGGGTAKDAAVDVPEKVAAYPEHNMFGRVLPSSGLYLRHVRGLTLTDVTTATTRPDARPAEVRVDVEASAERPPATRLVP